MDATKQRKSKGGRPRVIDANDRTTLHVVAETADVAIWKAAAAQNGEALSEWVRRTLDRIAAAELRARKG